jgi:hypothetical protein
MFGDLYACAFCGQVSAFFVAFLGSASPIGANPAGCDEPKVAGSVGSILSIYLFISYLFNRLMEGNMYRKSWFFDVFSLKFRVSTCFNWLPVSNLSIQRTRERCAAAALLTPRAIIQLVIAITWDAVGDPRDPYYILLGSGPIGPQINDNGKT